MLVFTGSSALNAWLPREQQRKPNDLDAIADLETATRYLKGVGCLEIFPINEGKTLFGRTSNLIYEIEIAWPDTTAASFLELIEGDAFQQVIDMDTNMTMLVPSINVLYMLKMSHRYLRNSPFFHKTRRDIAFMRTLGGQIPVEWSEWYKAREKATYWYESPNLDRGKEDFFVDQYRYDHDSIHEAVAFGERPAYTQYQHDGLRGVQCSKRMFLDDCSEYTRLCGVVEEASVLALERSLIPHAGKWSEGRAFEFALQKVCTSITSGWFREWSWEHYDEALALFKSRDISLLALLDAGIGSGVVKENPNYPAQ